MLFSDIYIREYIPNELTIEFYLNYSLLSKFFKNESFLNVVYYFIWNVFDAPKYISEKCLMLS